MLFWKKKEGVERERNVLGEDERRTGREKLPHTPLPHSIHIEGGVSTHLAKEGKGTTTGCY